MNNFLRNRLFGYWSLLIAVAVTISPGISYAQLLDQKKEPEPPPKNVPLQYPIDQLESMTLDEIQQEIDNTIPGFRESLKKMIAAKARYEHGTSAQAYEFGKNWRESATDGRTAFWKLKELVMVKYLKTEDASEELGKLAGRMAFDAVEAGRYGISDRVFQKLLVQAPDLPGLQFKAARVALLANNFEGAKKIPREPKLLEKLEPVEKALFNILPGYEMFWAEELEIRKTEAAADDLPRVEIETSKGKFVVELFENEAPHTVGNFISLVESGVYSNRFFHLVFRGFRAQGGVYSSKTGKPPADSYRIVNEANAENARIAFRGSIVMTPMPQSGATEFAIYTAPNAYGPPEDPELKETVFGRVISGMGVVEALKVNVRFKEGTTATERVNNREGDMPDDIIIAAKVLRKRPNVDYKPKKKESAVK